MVTTLALLALLATEPQTVAFATSDGGRIIGLLSGSGEHAVVLAHGARYNKESWNEQVPRLVAAGLQVLAVDFRGYGPSRGPGDDDALSAPLHHDILAAVRFLRERGARRVSVVGASLGGYAAADAAVAAEPGEIDDVVILSALASEHPEKIQGRKLFVVAREDIGPGGVPRLARIREQFDLAPEPKDLLVLEGSAHAQRIFETDQGERLLTALIQFLTAGRDR